MTRRDSVKNAYLHFGFTQNCPWDFFIALPHVATGKNRHAAIAGPVSGSLNPFVLHTQPVFPACLSAALSLFFSFVHFVLRD